MVKSKKQTKDTKPTKQKWSLKKKIAVIVGAILAFIAGIFIVATMATAAPLKSSDEFVKAIQDQDATTAYGMFADDAQTVVDEQQFDALVEQIAPIIDGEPKVISKEVDAKTGSDTTAKVVYEIAGSDDETYTFTVELVEISKEWKIMNFTNEKQ